jgi:hypothetical protein
MTFSRCSTHDILIDQRHAPVGTSLGRLRIMLRTIVGWRRIPAVPSQHILVVA